MAAGAAATEVGRYVGTVILNCQLFIVNCKLPKAGAKIGKIQIVVILGCLERL